MFRVFFNFPVTGIVPRTQQNSINVCEWRNEWMIHPVLYHVMIIKTKQHFWDSV